MVIPGQGGTLNPYNLNYLNAFPYFPTSSYDSGNNGELTNHPATYNLYNPYYGGTQTSIAVSTPWR